MSTSICLYFQVHQPYRLRRDFNFFNISGRLLNYEDEEKNREILERVAENCYLKTNKILLSLIKEFPNRFKVTFSFSGIVLEQLQKYSPKTLESFQELVATGAVEILSETYYHSLAYLMSVEEFKEQIQMHKEIILRLFNKKTSVFRNTELIYDDNLAKIIQDMGYRGILAEGAERILQWNSANFVYTPKGASQISLLLKNYRLSDDIAFRFSNKNWREYPLTAKKYATWLLNLGSNADVINLFMDYETFGEHQKIESGILTFLEEFPKEILKNPYFKFQTLSEVIGSYKNKGEVECKETTSWADESRDLSAWCGNSMQDASLDYLMSLEQSVKKLGDKNILDAWRKLTSSDHFYYMCTKWHNDGLIHSYFNPYKSPHDAFIIFTNVLNDLKLMIFNSLEKSE